MKNPKISYIIIYILEVVLGICMLIFTKDIFDYLSLIISGIITLFGVIKMVLSIKSQNTTQKTIASQISLIIGIILIFAGIFIFFMKSKVIEIIPILFGAYIILCAILSIRTIVILAKSGFIKWWFFIITTFILLGLGALIIYSPWKVMDITGKLIGITFIIKGINDMISLFLSYIGDSGSKKSDDEKAISIIDAEPNESKAPIYKDQPIADTDYSDVKANNTEQPLDISVDNTADTTIPANISDINGSKQ